MVFVIMRTRFESIPDTVSDFPQQIFNWTIVV